MGETVCDRKEKYARSETASVRLRSSETEFATSLRSAILLKFVNVGKDEAIWVIRIIAHTLLIRSTSSKSLHFIRLPARCPCGRQRRFSRTARTSERAHLRSALLVINLRR